MPPTYIFRTQITKELNLIGFVNYFFKKINKDIMRVIGNNKYGIK